MSARPSDQELVRACQAGDGQSLDRLVERHMRTAYALAHRLTGSHAEADDLAQEAFVRAWRGLSRFRGEAAFGSTPSTLSGGPFADSHEDWDADRVNGALDLVLGPAGTGYPAADDDLASLSEDQKQALLASLRAELES